MSVRTQPEREIFVQLPPNAGRGRYTPEPTEQTYYERTKLVPRLFKAANGGAASRDGHGWPYDMSIGGTHLGSQQGHLPHPAIHLVIPDRRSGLTAQGDSLRSYSTQRIPPVLVRTRLR